ncbi:hypothetical protein [Alicyclobacillus tolerans]|uniref:TrbC/VIRB2 family protein n=1 Tax=Alicyclobacillus tolerans TaxID=90970 RepID=A0A1M6UAY6_9BACL|nr:hypothetical protein [Alicyclobacillus montanus]SHK66321.1 hypothetical protein SAMN05443507_11924 [Alicyclobacillus montanus]
MLKSLRGWATTAAVSVIVAGSTMTADAQSQITNPLSGKGGSVSGIINSLVSWGLTAIAAVAGAFFLFHLYKAIIGFMAGSHHAQKREEAKTHLWYVVISGVLLGGAGVIAGALFNFGQHNL